MQHTVVEAAVRNRAMEKIFIVMGVGPSGYNLPLATSH
jgi:hypothetical protein